MLRNNNKRTKPNRRQPRKNQNTRSMMLTMFNRPDYPGQQVKHMRVLGPSVLVTTVGTAFSLAYPLGNASTQIIDWTDFSNSWDQYLLLSAHIQIQCLTPPTPGMAFFFIDASGNAALPSVADEGRDGVVRTNHSMNANRVWNVNYVPTNLTFFAYRNTTVDYTIGYFKGLTNLANFGTGALNTLLYRFTVRYEVLFKGRKM